MCIRDSAQRDKLRKYAEYQNMEIVQEFADEGKSGKSVEGRPEFQRMLDNIEAVSYTHLDVYKRQTHELALVNRER